MGAEPVGGFGKVEEGGLGKVVEGRVGEMVWVVMCMLLVAGKVVEGGRDGGGDVHALLAARLQRRPQAAQGIEKPLYQV